MSTSGSTTTPEAWDGDDSTEHRQRPQPQQHRRSPSEWAGLVLLAVAVLAFGAFVFVFGPLLAISCADCQDGVRGPLRFGGVLIAFAQYAAPLTTLGTLGAMFAMRRGARAGAIGLCALLLLLLLEQFLGQFTG